MICKSSIVFIEVGIVIGIVIDGNIIVVRYIVGIWSKRVSVWIVGIFKVGWLLLIGEFCFIRYENVGLVICGVFGFVFYCNIKLKGGIGIIVI